MEGILYRNVSDKKPLPKPVWYKNTFFWIAGILLVVAIVGLISGPATIRDPGQKPESQLVLLYFIASVVMFVNGALSHRQTVQQYQEEAEGSNQ